MAQPLFAKVAQELDFPKEERAILRFWQDARIFEKTLSKPSPRGQFVFYEGPPTANGLPHNGSVLTRVIKDVFPRYKTMRGFCVPRKAGWDTHGLPVEVEVEKELRIHGKAAIEAYGVEPFIKRCLESVFRYTKEWEYLTERVAFWVDLGDAYVTYHRAYVESVWWALSELFRKGLLYQGHKVVWWWAQGGTALSAGEVGQGYRAVDDPSVYVAFPLIETASREGGEAHDWAQDVSLLVWTTTPWTLPSNMYAAVHPQFDYVVARTGEGRRFLLAKELVAGLSKKLGELSVEREMKGRDIVGLRYRPPFDLFAGEAAGFEQVVFNVIPAEFVTLDTGTGIVHIAPAFGEDDHEAHRRIARERGAALPLFCAVKPDGTFFDRFDRYAGRWVKDCDKEIQHDLRDAGLLVFAELYRHDYPFCWRADADPLIQYARPAWYIRTTAAIDRAIDNSRSVHWLPEHVKEGRFGDFLAHNVDWALSRERWWGTPLNVWVCDRDPEHKEVPSSVAEIEARNPAAFDHFHAARRLDPSLSEHLMVHKPWVDQVVFACASCGGPMRRVPEVIDCWFDSGCMPFAQWGYPHRGRERFEQSFPADFISEAIDQTRGWFYSLLMISTLVFDSAPYPHPFKTCIVLGHVTDKEGKKESKSKGNYTLPEIILDRVAMEFAVWGSLELSKIAGQPLPAGAIVSKEDFEGMDLHEGSSVRVYRREDPTAFVDLPVVADKRVPRRVVVLGQDVRATLGVLPCATKDVKPADVPRLSPDQRVTVEDPSTPAPGADAFRWFFYAASPPWSATRHALSNVRALQKEYAVKLRNVYSFFTIYANIDGFRPGARARVDHAARPELDRWILGELAMTTRDVTARMDEYDVFSATRRLIDLVDSLSNWWVRRSRARFWRSGWDDDKRDAYETLYETLVAITKLTAPFTPYAAEGMYQNLVVRAAIAGARESVHLEDWPVCHASSIDEPLSRKIAAVRGFVSLGLQVRTQAKIKVRQPLRYARIIAPQIDLLDDSARRQLDGELNVLETLLVTMADAPKYVEFRLKPNFRTLGQRGLGKAAQGLKKTMAALPREEAGELASRLMAGASITIDGVELGRDDAEIELVAKDGFAAAGDRLGVVLLDTRIDDELRDQGLLREIANRVQTIRKEMGLEYTDRIRIRLAGSDRVRTIVDRGRDVLSADVLAVHIATTAWGEQPGSSPAEEPAPQASEGGEPPRLDGQREVDLEGERVRISVERA